MPSHRNADTSPWSPAARFSQDERLTAALLAEWLWVFSIGLLVATSMWTLSPA